MYILLIALSLLFHGTLYAQTIFSQFDAENGTMSQWSVPWGVKSDRTNPVPSNVTTVVKSGSRAFKYEITDPQISGHYSQTLSGSPNLQSMGSPNGKYLSGYYSFWVYIDSGFTETDWNMLIGWMTGVSGAPSPIAHVELRRWPNSPAGPLQLAFHLKNAFAGCYTAPTIPGYELTSSYYFQTASSPNGITPFPTKQWVHVGIYYKMAQTNGRVIIWQDGVKIMDLTNPAFNTFWGHSITPCTNAAGDMIFQFGIYGGAKTTPLRMYVDDFKVTDYQVSGQPATTLTAPSNLKVSW